MVEIKKPGMSLVINGCKDNKKEKDEMEAATLPIEWFFDDNIATFGPTHLVIIDQTEYEFKSLNHDLRNGRRYLVAIGDGMKYMQIHTAGIHKITAYALKLEKRSRHAFDLGDAKKYCQIQHKGIYDYGILLLSQTFENSALAITEEYIKVPKELFAQKPKSELGQAWWNWVHMWHTPPDDNCSNRGRTILALFVKPEIYLLWLSLRGLIASIFTLVILVFQLIIIFAGWKPDSMLESLHGILRNAFRLDLYGHCNDPFAISGGYKVWGKHKLPVSALELSAGLAAIYGSYRLFVWLGNSVFIFMLAAALVILLVLGIYSVCRDVVESWSKQSVDKASMRAKIELDAIKKKLKAKKASEEEWANWLKSNLSSTKKPTRVDEANLPDPYNGKLRVFTTRLFWKLKKGVMACRPYER